MWVRSGRVRRRPRGSTSHRGERHCTGCGRGAAYRQPPRVVSFSRHDAEVAGTPRSVEYDRACSCEEREHLSRLCRRRLLDDGVTSVNHAALRPFAHGSPPHSDARNAPRDFARIFVWKAGRGLLYARVTRGGWDIDVGNIFCSAAAPEEVDRRGDQHEDDYCANDAATNNGAVYDIRDRRGGGRSWRRRRRRSNALNQTEPRQIKASQEGEGRG